MKLSLSVERRMSNNRDDVYMGESHMICCGLLDVMFGKNLSMTLFTDNEKPKNNKTFAYKCLIYYVDGVFWLTIGRIKVGNMTSAIRHRLGKAYKPMEVFYLWAEEIVPLTTNNESCENAYYER